MNLVKIGHFKQTLFKKEIAGIICSSNESEFLYEEKGIFNKRRKLLICKKVVAESMGNQGSIKIDSANSHLHVYKNFLKGIALSVSLNGEQKTIDGLCVERPFDKQSDVYFFDKKKTVCHLVLQQTPLFECFSKLKEPRELDRLENGMFPLSLFFLCCRASRSSDGFSGGDGF